MDYKKRKIRRVDMKIVERILNILNDTGPIFKTRLSLKASLSYNQFIRYLEWMKSMDLIKECTNNDKMCVVFLTDKGRHLYFD